MVSATASAGKSGPGTSVRYSARVNTGLPCGDPVADGDGVGDGTGGGAEGRGYGGTSRRRGAGVRGSSAYAAVVHAAVTDAAASVRTPRRDSRRRSVGVAPGRSIMPETLAGPRHDRVRVMSRTC